MRLLEDPADLKKDYPGGLTEAHEPFESDLEVRDSRAQRGSPGESLLCWLRRQPAQPTWGGEASRGRELRLPRASRKELSQVSPGAENPATPLTCSNQMLL